MRISRVRFWALLVARAGYVNRWQQYKRNDMKEYLFTAIYFIFIVFAVSSGSVADEIDVEKGCQDNPFVVGECFLVHGRIRLYNGTPSIRIWPIGTKRLLGVLPPENEIMPLNVFKHIAWGIDIFGDFVVCPFTKEQIGHMQCVCIESASNLILEHHKAGGESEVIVIKE
jgi:hypothetical protein